MRKSTSTILCALVALGGPAGCGSAVGPSEGEDDRATATADVKPEASAAPIGTGAAGTWSIEAASGLPACPFAPAAPIAGTASLRFPFDGELTLEGNGPLSAACGLRLAARLRNPASEPARPLRVQVRYAEQAGLAPGKGESAELLVFVNGRPLTNVSEDVPSGEGVARIDVPVEGWLPHGGVEVLLVAAATRPSTSARARVRVETIDINCPMREPAGCWPAPKPKAASKTAPRPAPSRPIPTGGR